MGCITTKIKRKYVSPYYRMYVNNMNSEHGQPQRKQSECDNEVGFVKQKEI